MKKTTFLIIFILLAKNNLYAVGNSSATLKLSGVVNGACVSGFGSSYATNENLDFGNIIPGQAYNENINFYITCISGTVINGLTIKSQNKGILKGNNSSNKLVYSLTLNSQSGVGYSGGLFNSTIQLNNVSSMINTSSITIGDSPLGTNLSIITRDIPENITVDKYKDTLIITTNY